MLAIHGVQLQGRASSGAKMLAARAKQPKVLLGRIKLYQEEKARSQEKPSRDQHCQDL
jgi:hypothetical protein